MKKIYERNYSCMGIRNLEEDTSSSCMLSDVFAYRMEYAGADKLHEIPRAVKKNAGKNYRSLLKKCDQLAQRTGGTIRGTIDYGEYDADIEVILPYAEFCTLEDRKVLQEIAERAVTVLFESTQDGELRILLTVAFFHHVLQDNEPVNMRENDAMFRRDLSRVSLVNALATLTDEIQNSLPQLTLILKRIETATEIPREELASAFVCTLDEQEVDITDLRNVNRVADELIASFRKTSSA